MKKRLIWIGTGLFILLLTIFLKDFVKEWIIIPLLSVIRMIENLRQDVVWFLFVGLIIFFAYKNLSRWRISWAEKRYSGRYDREHLDYLTNLIRNAPRSDFLMVRMAQYLSKLTIEILAYGERLTPKEIKKRLLSGDLSLPRDIFDFLLAALETDGYASMKREKLTDHYPSLKLDPLRVVEFLENQLNPNIAEPEDYHEDKDQRPARYLSKNYNRN